MRTASKWIAALAVLALAACGAPESGPSPQESSDALTSAVWIYTDALATGWQDWSWATVNLANTSPVASGTQSISVDFGPWTGLYLHTAGVSTAGLTYLDLRVNGGSQAGAKLNAKASINGTLGAPVALAPYCNGKTIPANAWTRCFVPLTALGAANATIDGVVIQEGAGLSLPRMYFDAIRLAAVTVSVSPATVSVATGAAQAFAASVTNTANTAVTWAVKEGTPGGVVSSSGLYTAPASGGTYHVVATSQADPSKSATSTVSVASSSSTAVAVAISPATAALVPGATQSFAATVTNTTNTAVTWTVQEGAAGGVVSGGGVYTAPATAGTYHVVATSQADATKAAIATVTVTAAAPVAVAISPAGTSVTVGGSTAFTATVTNTTNTAVTWTVQEGASGGAISSAGVYTAPATAGTYHVVATSQADGTRSAVATVTVTAAAPVAVTISPSSAALTFGATQTFSAAVTNTTNTTAVWTVQEGAAGGSISSAGVYTAPSAAGTYHVVATSQADSTKSAVATVTVSAPPSTGSTYALPADRATRWKPGVTYNGGIPTNRTQCGSTYPSSTSAATIQNALDTCPDNTFVLLGPGTFSLSSGLHITRSNISLRGSGAGVTILSLASAGSDDVVAVGNWDGVPNGWMDWRTFTSDGVKGSNTVTVNSTTGLAVGEIVHVNEQYDSALTYYNRRAPQGDCSPLQSTDYLGWGECRCANSGCVARGCSVQTSYAAAWAQSRPVGQAMEIASISGTTLTFTTPFHVNFRTSKAAHLARLGSNNPASASFLEPAVKWVGIENLSVTRGGAGDGWGNLYFSGTAYCWAKNVESFQQAAGGSIVIAGGFRNEVRDSYLRQATDPNPGGAGYGFVLDTYASDNLYENNISWSFNKVIAMRSSGGGNVIGYSYFEDGYGQGYPTIMEVGINASHMAGSHMELFEGNEGFNFDSDSYWGTQHNVVAFRNHFASSRRNLPGNLATLVDQYNRRAVGLTSFQRNYSFVGNVLGYPNNYLQGVAVGHTYPATFSGAPQGTTLKYEWTGGAFGSDASPAYTPMWQIGYDGSGYDCTGGWITTPDTTAVSTTLRDGNFDFVTNAVHWHGIGGTGTGQTTPPAAFALPNSLYLTTRPAFFGSNPWPWVDGGNAANPLPGPLPARARFDAGTPNTVP